MRTAGISKRPMDVVFHQLGALSKDIFSSAVSLDTSSSTLADRKDRDIVNKFRRRKTSVRVFGKLFKYAHT